MNEKKYLKQKLSFIWPYLNERSRRLVVAAEAVQLGRGGVTLLSRTSGLSRVTITKGIRELWDETVPTTRIRREGAGRPSLQSADPNLPRVLEALLEPPAPEGADSPLRWTCKSTRALARELACQDRSISHEKVAQILRSMNYSLQGNRKTENGDDDSGRNEQFQYINNKVHRTIGSRNPIISVHTKKKESIDNVGHKVRKWGKVRMAEQAPWNNYTDQSILRAYPYGIYDLGLNRGFVNVVTDHDTATFAAASIRGWWRHEGRRVYPRATELLITADGGGSNGHGMRHWKVELQKMADEIGLPIAVCHLPPGIRRWNNLEHRLVSFISSNWRGEPLRDCETIVQLIAKTTSAKGLPAVCRLDRRKYRIGRTVSDKEMATINIVPEEFHGEWNYAVRPKLPAN